MLPGMLKCVLDSMDMLKELSSCVFQKYDRWHQGKSNKDGIIRGEESYACNLLNPYIVPTSLAEIYKESIKTKVSIRDLILRKGLMTKEEIDRILSKENILGST